MAALAVWDADSNTTATSGFFAGLSSRNQRMGGDGFLGTIGAGYDWQLAGSWVAGVFADGMFGSLKGSITDPLFGEGGGLEGTEKLRSTWAVGARLGYLVAPNVLSYVNAGYTGSEWSGASLTALENGVDQGFSVATSSFHRDGWFIGGGVESNLNIFGITAPGWNIKTEYRAAYFNRVTESETTFPGDILTFKPWVQTVSTSLVYRFNSGNQTAFG